MRKPTGEKKVFKEIWEEREHVSFISGFRVNGVASNFAHVLAKGMCPNLRLSKENIVLLTPHEHYLLDHSSEDKRQKYVDEWASRGIAIDWQKLYDLKEELKTKNKTK